MGNFRLQDMIYGIREGERERGERERGFDDF
jgi:hypothetical protein